MKKVLLVVLLALPLAWCKPAVNHDVYEAQLTEVDQRSDLVNKNAREKNLESILTIDHSRLASKAGAHLAASRVDFYSDDALNTALLKHNLQAGLDLPFRVLNYVEDGTVKTIYTDAEFIQIRHGIEDEMGLRQYDQNVRSLVAGLDDAVPVNSDTLTQGYGIETLVSDYDFDATLKNIKRNVLRQSDTVWFMNLDFQARAAAIGESLPKATLLVFGGPVPGAQAMTDFPSLGLDTFGQKVMVFEEDGQVMVSYNNIVDMSELHYGRSAISHRVINFRLARTLSGAIEK